MLRASGGECSSFAWVVAFKPELLLGQEQLDPGGLIFGWGAKSPWPRTVLNFLWSCYVAPPLASCPGWETNPTHSDRMLQADKLVVFYSSPVLCYHKVSSSDFFVLAYICEGSAEPSLQNWVCLKVKPCGSGQCRAYSCKKVHSSLWCP